jgi:hypothetical protein
VAIMPDFKVMNSQKGLAEFSYGTNKIKEFYSVWDKRTKELEKVMTRLEFIELNKLSQEDLLKEFNNFFEEFSFRSFSIVEFLSVFWEASAF